MRYLGVSGIPQVSPVDSARSVVPLHGYPHAQTAACSEGGRYAALIDNKIQLESANPREAKITSALLDPVDKMPDVAVADRAYDLDELRDGFAESTSKLLAPHRFNHKKPPRDQEQIERHYKQ